MATESRATAFLNAVDLPLPQAAYSLASAGVPVFPCAPDGKKPLIYKGGGFKAATTNLRQVKAWWRGTPSANIGVPTGAVSGLVVVDVDVHDISGYDALYRAGEEGLVSGWEFQVRSPTGGLHIYYPAERRSEQRSWQVGDAGIDFRGDGGYIVAPPSRRVIDGETVAYQLTVLGTDPVQPLDAGRLRDFLSPPRPKRAFPTHAKQQGATDPQKLADWLAGERTDRNRKLFWASCLLAEEQVPFTSALDAMLTVEQPDFGRREITTTVRSGYKRITGTDPATGETAASRGSPAGIFESPETPERTGAGRGL